MFINNDIEKIKNIIFNTVKCDKIYLFGSYAYGVPKEDSDYDFYVVFPNDGIHPNEASDNIYHALYRKTNKRPVDILVTGKDNFEKRKNLLTLENEVFNKGLVLYG